MARTIDIGLRREPHPPIPIVIPSRQLGDDVVLGEALVFGHDRLRRPASEGSPTRSARFRGVMVADPIRDHR